MARRFCTIIVFAICVLMINAQEYIDICKTKFLVILDYENATAVISESEEFTKIRGSIKDKTKRTLPIIEFYNQGGIIGKLVKTMGRKIDGIDKKNKTLIIPANVTIMGRDYTIVGIGDGAFAALKNFENVEIPNTVTTIGDYAFYMTNIKSVVLPESLVSIGECAFAETKLEDVVIPHSVKYIAINSFDDCSKLTRLCVPEPLMSSISPKNVNKNFRVTLNYAEKPVTAEKPIVVQAIQSDEKVSENIPVVAVSPQEQKNTKVTTSDVEMNIPRASESAENTFAFIIANENYQSDATVEYAIQDGRTFRNYCSIALGIPDENIKYCEDATLNNIRSIINKMCSIADVYGADSKMIFYYSGHGVPDERGNSYLLPIDGNARDPQSGYSLNTLYETLGKLEVGNVIVFIDACFSGRQRDESLLVEGTKGGLRALKEEVPKGKMIVLSASKGDETAHVYPEKGHSLFTYFLLKKIKECNGNLTMGELADYVNDNVRKKAVTVLDSTQNPTTQVSPAIKTIWQNITLK